MDNFKKCILSTKLILMVTVFILMPSVHGGQQPPRKHFHPQQSTQIYEVYHVQALQLIGGMSDQKAFLHLHSVSLRVSEQQDELLHT